MKKAPSQRELTDTRMAVLTELDPDQTALALSGRSQDQEQPGDRFDTLFAAAAEQLRRFAPKRERAVLDG